MFAECRVTTCPGMSGTVLGEAVTRNRMSQNDHSTLRISRNYSVNEQKYKLYND